MIKNSFIVALLLINFLATQNESFAQTCSGSYQAAINSGTTSQYYRGDKTWQTLNKASVSGLTDTSDVIFNSVKVNGSVSGYTFSFSGGFGATTGGGGGYYTCCAGTYGVVASNRMAAAEFNANSDIRIKDVIGLSDSKKDLEILNAIEITDYRYKDKNKGNQPVKKVIGQQVKKIFPQAVHEISEFVPDILKYSIKVNRGKIYLKKHGLSKGDMVKLYNKKGDAIEARVVDVSKNEFTIDKQKSDKLGEKVFVYGKMVNDFLVVDYDALTSLAISSLQEMNRKINSLQKELEKNMDK